MKFSHRRAISPIIATVLIIAVTLIAAVAIGGFVFGIFGSASSSAQVQVTSQDLVAADMLSTNTAAAPTCNIPAAAQVNDLTLTNTGTAATSVTGVTITWAGQVNSFAISGVCTVTAAGAPGATTAGNPIVILFTTTNQLSTSGTVGQTYTGTVTLGNGADLLFSGTFN
jgi:flagellin-like protein